MLLNVCSAHCVAEDGGASGWLGCTEDPARGRAGGGCVFRALRACPAPGKPLRGSAACRLSVPWSLLSPAVLRLVWASVQPPHFPWSGVGGALGTPLAFLSFTPRGAFGEDFVAICRLYTRVLNTEI